VQSFGVLSIVAENQQLHAVLRMRLSQVGALRTAERLAFDRPREQFRRDLHDGVQQTIAAAWTDSTARTTSRARWPRSTKSWSSPSTRSAT
jgi:hypothetical protein